jgi:hypothetical protein
MSSKSSRKSTVSESTSSSVKSSKAMDATTAAVITVIYNLLILGYILSLEDKKCGCISDWRHDFIKYYSIALIIWGLLTIGFGFGTSKNEFVVLLKNILMIAALYNLWCLYTYIGDLDKTKCSCAIDKQKNMHYFLYLWRYILVGALLMALVSIIFVTLKSM